MKYSKEEIIQFIAEEDVKFIRLAFTDMHGRLKNISVMQSELDRAFRYGVSIDASAIGGFADSGQNELFLRPDPSTIYALPWRPDHGRVIRMFCSIACADGSAFECDTRAILKRAIADASRMGISFAFGSEMEFYLFKRDEEGNPTKIPYDNAGYLDVAPADRGENVRREICLSLESMGLRPESSHHEEGPGQNEIDFRYADALTAADDAVTFWNVVDTIAYRNGLKADFTPLPLENFPGNGMQINISAKGEKGRDYLPQIIAGILDHILEITLFLNTVEDSYERFGKHKAPCDVSWAFENRLRLIRIPSATGESRRCELRSPDPMCNPYLAYALLIWSGLDGIKRDLTLPSNDENSFYCKLAGDPSEETVMLPRTLEEAKEKARTSEFIAKHLPKAVINHYTK